MMLVVMTLIIMSQLLTLGIMSQLLTLGIMLMVIMLLQMVRLVSIGVLFILLQELLEMLSGMTPPLLVQLLSLLIQMT